MTLGAFLAGYTGELTIMACLLIASAFFSGTETALFNLTKGQVHHLRHSGHNGHIIAELMDTPLRTLNSLLLGNLLVNVAYGAISAAIVLDLPSVGLPAWAALPASLIPLLALILFGEVMPKMIAYVLDERWALPVARAVGVTVKITSRPLGVVNRLMVGPITRMLVPRRVDKGTITADELASVLDLSATRGIIEPNANTLLQEIIDLTDLRVGNIMVPRVDIVAYDVNAGPAGLRRLFRRSKLRRIPIYEGDIDNVLGLIHARSLLLQKAPRPLRELVKPMVFTPEAGNLERLLQQFQAKRAQIAIVVDEYGGTAGLVALQDVLEEIVGEIPEPGEARRAPAVRRITPQTYLIDADLPIHEWADAFAIDLLGRRISTVGGFVTSLLGRIPRIGDAATYRNLRFTVRSMRRSRIDSLHLELLEEPS